MYSSNYRYIKKRTIAIMNSSNKLFVITGPTGIGKTDLLYRYLNQQEQLFEVVSLDSRQVYRYMSIGTASPEPYVKERIPHHLVEFLEPNQSYSAGKFVKDAESIIQDIWNRKRIPILCGGTGFYLKAFRTGMFYIDEDLKKKQEIRNMLNQLSAQERLQLLQEIDPLSITTDNQRLGMGFIHPNDTYRIYRSLELYYLTGKTLSMHYKEINRVQNKKEYEGIFIIPDLEKWENHLKIRAEKMVERGFIEEAINLFKNYGDSPALKTPGYKETYELYLKFGEKLLHQKEFRKEIIHILYSTHKKYGKAQIKWFKNEKSLIPVTYHKAEKFLEKLANLAIINN